MIIGDVDLDATVMVIAEIGNNHEGDFGLAKEMLIAAAESGANAVKFQAIVPEKLVAPSEVARIEQLKRFCLSPDHFLELAEIAKAHGTTFLVTPFDVSAVDYLDKLVPAYKIASGDNDFVPLLRRVAATSKPVIMSTGLANLERVQRSLKIIYDVWEGQDVNPGVALLHCVVSYPTDPDHARISELDRLADLGVVVGYSDHTLGLEASMLAVARGARIIEKHFTINKNHSDFRDHKLSADPQDMRALVEHIRGVEILMGRANTQTSQEENSRSAVRRALYASRALSVGQVLTEEDVICLRPCQGIPVEQYDSVIGRVLGKDIVKGSPLQLEDLVAQ